MLISKKKTGKLLYVLADSVKAISHAFLSSMIAVMFVTDKNLLSDERILVTGIGFIIFLVICEAIKTNTDESYPVKNENLEEILKTRASIESLSQKIDSIKFKKLLIKSKPKPHIRLKAKKS